MYADFTTCLICIIYLLKLFFVIKWSIIIAFNFGFFLEFGIYSETMSESSRSPDAPGELQTACL